MSACTTLLLAFCAVACSQALLRGAPPSQDLSHHSSPSTRRAVAVAGDRLLKAWEDLKEVLDQAGLSHDDSAEWITLWMEEKKQSSGRNKFADGLCELQNTLLLSAAMCEDSLLSSHFIAPAVLPVLPLIQNFSESLQLTPVTALSPPAHHVSTSTVTYTTQMHLSKPYSYHATLSSEESSLSASMLAPWPSTTLSASGRVLSTPEVYALIDLFDDLPMLLVDNGWVDSYFVAENSGVVNGSHLEGFHAVLCDCPVSLTAECHVIAVLMRNEVLSRSMPSSVAAFTALRLLDLANTGLSESLPSELGLLTNLQYIFLNDNQLGGWIPHELGNLIELRVLDVSRNQFYGPIPEEYGNWIHLRYLDASVNYFNSRFPVSLCKCTNLVHLDVSINQLYLLPEFPTEFGLLTNLQYLNMQRNSELSVMLPPEIGLMRNLRYVDFGRTTIYGNLPSELGLLSELRYIHLNGNYLSGQLPSELASLENLVVFDVEYNMLSGQLPFDLTRMVFLEQLNLNFNHLTGTLASEFGQLPLLQYIGFNGNDLSGAIPSELGQLPKLWYFDIYDNQCTGIIPSELGLIDALLHLNLGHNSLTGLIPVELADTSLEYLGYE